MVAQPSGRLIPQAFGIRLHLPALSQARLLDGLPAAIPVRSLALRLVDLPLARRTTSRQPSQIRTAPALTPPRTQSPPPPLALARQLPVHSSQPTSRFL